MLGPSCLDRYAPTETPAGSVKLLQPDRYRLGLAPSAVTAKAISQYDGLLSRGLHPPAAYIVESIQVRPCKGSLTSDYRAALTGPTFGL